MFPPYMVVKVGGGALVYRDRLLAVVALCPLPLQGGLEVHPDLTALLLHALQYTKQVYLLDDIAKTKTSFIKEDVKNKLALCGSPPPQNALTNIRQALKPSVFFLVYCDSHGKKKTIVADNPPPLRKEIMFFIDIFPNIESDS